MPDGATVKTSKAAIGFRYCNKLFAEERKCILYQPEYRKEYRQGKELPLPEEYFAWLNTVHPEKGSKLEEAVRYSINQKQQFCAFLITEKFQSPITLPRMRSDPLPWDERTGCFAIP